MSEPGNYGKRYYCVKVPENISSDREIYLHADYAKVSENGTLTFYGKYHPDKLNEELQAYLPDYEDTNSEEIALLTLNKDCWNVYYAASCLDGHAVAAVHWSGEIYERVR